MKLKTITLGAEDNPSITICPGHVDSKTFRVAMNAEGWDDNDEPTDLSHEWWTETKGSWNRSEKDKTGAQAVTVMDW